MIRNILRLFLNLKERNAFWKAKLLKGLLFDKEKILDFGCGDLTFASEIAKEYSHAEVTGVDIIVPKKIPKKVSFIHYDGEKIPFRSNTFDTVIAFYVFHHCSNAKAAFSECLRVAKKRVIIVEAIPRNSLEIFPMRIMDFFYNIWKFTSVFSADQYFTLSEWRKIIKKYRGKIGHGKKVKTFFSIISVGTTYIFEIHKQK